MMAATDGSPPEQFAVRRSDDAEGVVIALSGELDLAVAPELETMLREIELNGHERLLLDLSRLMFMDSTGLAAVIEGKRHADASGCRLILRSPTVQVRRLLNLTGLIDQLTVEE
jgi:anti-sigma B factor antagonist